MATTRATFGSVLSVVTSTATAAVSLLDNINSGIDMLSVEINDAKASQHFASIKHKALVEKRAKSEFITELTELNLQLVEYANKSAEHAEAVASAANLWEQLIAPKK